MHSSSHTDLAAHLASRSATDTTRRLVADTVGQIAGAAIDQAAALRRALLRGDHDDSAQANADGDRQRRIDLDAHDAFLAALTNGAVAAVASEEADDIVTLDVAAPLLVAIDPLDGSANLAVDAPLGVIFSIRPAIGGRSPTADDFLTPGSAQLAAGIVLYGPATVMAVTVGDGTDVFVLDEDAGCFRPIHLGVQVPLGTREFAINTSNSRHWTPAMRAYISDLVEGADGPRGNDFNMRWYGALVADAYRILQRGGVFLYPDDGRSDYGSGRLRMVYEAQAIAMLFEQAGGAATDGVRRILDVPVDHLHARTPLVFGSADKVERIARHLQAPDAEPVSPLFGSRGLFRQEAALR
jgi:fructose-1,6-bisphosphatase I